MGGVDQVIYGGCGNYVDVQSSYKNIDSHDVVKDDGMSGLVFDPGISSFSSSAVLINTFKQMESYSSSGSGRNDVYSNHEGALNHRLETEDDVQEELDVRAELLDAGLLINSAVVQCSTAVDVPSPSKIVSLVSFVSNDNVTDDLRVDLVAGLPVNSTLVQSTTADAPFNLGIISPETRCEGINISNSLGIGSGIAIAVSGDDHQEHTHVSTKLGSGIVVSDTHVSTKLGSGIVVSGYDHQEYSSTTNFGDYINFGQSRKEGWRNQGGGG
jgi:hypothetical protein